MLCYSVVITIVSDNGANYCDVCSLAYLKNYTPNLTKFSARLNVAVARSSPDDMQYVYVTYRYTK